MKTITSRQNPEIITASALANPKERAIQKRFIAEGSRTIATLLASPLKLLQLYVSESLVATAQTLTSDAHITLVSDSVMEKLSQASSPSGIVGIFSIPAEPSAAQLSSGIVLARISDPGNMGTLIRTCAALDLKSVVVIEGVDPWNPKVIQASAGTIGHVNIFRWDWETVIKNKARLLLYALTISGGQNPSTINRDNALIIVGNEADGIPDAWINECDATITLEMANHVESLNAAVAGSIALYAACKKI